MTPLHTYRLEKYHGTASRHRCPHCNRPRCFTLYVDAQGRPLHPTVGRCDHESSCAYHYTPRQFFADHPTLHPASPKASPSQRHSVATGRTASCPTPQRLCTIPCNNCVVSIFQMLNKIIGICQFCCLINLCIAGFQVSVTNVFSDSSCKQMSILLNHS